MYMYLVCVVEVQKPALALVNVLVARICASHNHRCVHMDVVAGKVQSNQALEDDRPAREGGRQEDE